LYRTPPTTTRHPTLLDPVRRTSGGINRTQRKEQAMREKVAAVMPDVIADLERLIRIPSVAFPGFPPEPVHEMAAATVDVLRRAGADNARLLDVPGGYPAVYADVEGPPGTPTVLLYAHYDVQPAPLEQGWLTDPFTPATGPDGRIHGRGAADDKSGIAIHAGTLRAFDGRPPVGLRILIEGEEETVSHLPAFLEDHPDLVRCDAFVIADMGGPAVGEPALTTALRGHVQCTITVRTLDDAVHSGLFGGAAPDALLALIRALGTLHDDHGDVAVPGLHSAAWTGAGFDEEAFRASATMRDGTGLVGTGTLADRLWAKPSITVLAIDAPPLAHAANVLIPQASARIALRVPPGCDPVEQLDHLMTHLRAGVPWGAEVDVAPFKIGPPFQVDTGHPAVRAARDALETAYGKPARAVGAGGSIPLVATLNRLQPDAGVVLWGAEDIAAARIHAANESVDPAEVQRCVLAQTLMLETLAEGAQPPR
jgi:acetylornithine deacetylase/succinyl-diaminopimelate desuccinylase-like protein